MHVSHYRIQDQRICQHPPTHLPPTKRHPKQHPIPLILRQRLLRLRLQRHLILIPLLPHIPIQQRILLARQPLPRRLENPRDPRRPKRRALAYHLGDALCGEVDLGHAVAVEAGEDVLARFGGDGAGVGHEVGGVAFGLGWMC